MPFFKAGMRLVYYAHVPKCGGTSVADYIQARFGPLALYERDYMSRPQERRWTRSSPQHVAVVDLERMIPPDMFDSAFAVVRHPVSRAVSTYHFQLELERSVSPGTGFSEWLGRLNPDAPFAYDNHVRPMDAIVPQGAAVFHLEHGIDALVGWFDLVAGDRGGPRAILPENARGAHVQTKGLKARPTPADIDRIAKIYSPDFERFGYEPGQPMPKASAPELDGAFLTERDRSLAAANRPLARLGRRLRRRLARL